MERSAPFVRLLLPFVVGIAFALLWPSHLPHLGWVLGVAVVCVWWLAIRPYRYAYRWVFGAVTGVTLVLMGYLRTNWMREINNSSHFSQRVPAARTWVGTILEPPTRGPRWKVPVQVEAAAASNDSLIVCTGKLLLFIDTAYAEKHLVYGQRLQFRTKAQPAAPPRNPYAFDYGAYLARQQIFHTAFLGVDSSLTVLGAPQGTPWWRWAYGQRARMLAVLEQYFPDVATRSIAAGLLTGFKADLPDELRQAYIDTGSMHALAVSGSHIVFLQTVLLLLLTPLKRAGRNGERVQLGVVLMVVWAFTLLTGATPAVLRASVMFSIYAVGKAFYRSSSAWNLLAASAFLLLAYNPYWLADAGFQLSYAAVAGMVIFIPLFNAHLPPTTSLVSREIRNALLTGVAAQLGTLPLALYYFHQFPVYFWLAGWIVVAGGAAFMCAGPVLFILHAFWTEGAVIWGKLLNSMLYTMNAIIGWIQHLPGSTIGGIWISAGEAALWGVVVAVLGRWGKRSDVQSLKIMLMAIAMLGLVWAVRVYGHLGQREVIVYAVSGHTLLDFVDGETAFTLQEAQLPARAEYFAAGNYRLAHGIRQQTALALNSDTALAHIVYRAPWVQFFDKTLLHLTPELAFPSELPPAIWLLLVSDDAPPLSAELWTRCRPQQVVLDGSNHRATVLAWQAACAEQGIPFHATQQAGAWEHYLGR